MTSGPDPRVALRLAELAQQWELPAAFPRQAELLLRLVRDSPHSLTTVRDPAEGAELHVADSLTGLAVPELRSAGRIADLGAGAGFPGLVLAAALPDTALALVESVAKKADFIRSAAAELELVNVEVVPMRAEEWRPETGLDVVTARALAPLGVLLEYAAPLLRSGGLMVAWKGRRDASEESAGRQAAEVLGMSVPESLTVSAASGANRHLYLSHKVAETPARFPRRPGMARKRPLAP